MTVLEMRAMLARVDARKLREDAGIRRVTVARALGVNLSAIYYWESGRREPMSAAGIRWARFTLGLERHAAVTPAMWRDEAA